MGFSRQEYWSGLPFPSPGDCPNSGIEPGSPMLQADTLPSEPPGKLAFGGRGGVPLSQVESPEEEGKTCPAKPRTLPGEGTSIANGTRVPRSEGGPQGWEGRQSFWWQESWEAQS